MRIRSVAILLAGPLITAGLAERLPDKVELVLVPVSVIDSNGATVTGLDRQRFKLTEDNIPRSIVSFTQQDVLCSVGVIVDTSGRMFHQLEAAKTVVRAFLDTVAPRHEAPLMSVSSRPRVESANSLRWVTPGGSTALLDTLYLALNRTRPVRNPRRALLVVSDGMDPQGRHSKDDLMRMATEADVQIYTISIGGPAQVRGEHGGLTLLEDLADKTGGLHHTVNLSNSAEQVAKLVGLAIRNQYVIGYRPAEVETSGKWHKIRVSLDVPNTNVHARNGYYSR